MQQPLLTLDDALIILYRLNSTLLRAARASNSAYTAQLAEELVNPKPLDFIMIAPEQQESQPIALQIGRLITISQETATSPPVYTVQLLDGTVTCWKGKQVLKIPTAIFCMRSDA